MLARKWVFWMTYVVIVYRSPYSVDHQVLGSVFITKFSEYLEYSVLCKEQLLITEDFNFHIDDVQDPNSAFLDMYFYVVFFQSALTCACRNCLRVFSVEWAKGECASPALVTSNTFPRFIRFFGDDFHSVFISRSVSESLASKAKTSQSAWSHYFTSIRDSCD